jgi:predicted Fe-Mo cluster-binding NifX family protein
VIAIPVKTDKEDTALAPLFGKSKWFALVDGDAVTFWRNDIQSGREVVDHFKAIGVDTVIFHDMGANPCLLLQRAQIACYHSGKGRVLLKEALTYLKDGVLIEVTPMNMAEFVEKGQKHSSGEHHEHHEHHDGEHCHHS